MSTTCLGICAIKVATEVGNNSKTTGWVGAGADNADAFEVICWGTAAANLLEGNITVVVEYVSVTTTLSLCHTFSVDVLAKLGERKCKDPIGAEAHKKISGAAGSGKTGLYAVMAVWVTGTKSSVHDFPTLIDCVE